MAAADASGHTFGFGDRVVHAGKPEWGVGVVSKARNTMHEGSLCQSVTVRFERGGLKTLSTAFAELVPEREHEPAAPQPDIMPHAEDSDGGRGGAGSAGHANGEAPARELAEHTGSWLDQASGVAPDKAMARLPESCTDPFLSLERRVENTLKQFRFTPTGGSLLDWAAAQTGLADPLSRFSRQELEQFFRRYADARANHLAELARELSKNDKPALNRLMQNAPPVARDVVRRGHAGR
jgi:hypothetical protein